MPAERETALVTETAYVTMLRGMTVVVPRGHSANSSAPACCVCPSESLPGAFLGL
jgi:hypothetical protein